MRDQLGLPSDALLTVFLGRLTAKKGLDMALRSFRSVAEQRKNAFFLIVGPDDEETGRGARKLAGELRLEDRVRFLGEVRGEAQRAVWADADLFRVSSN